MTRAVVGAVLIGLLITGCSSSPAASSSSHRSAARSDLPPPAIDPCPSRGSASLSGHSSTLGEHSFPCLRPGPHVDVGALGGRRPVLVNLWASWCLPCQREMPRLERTYNTYRGQLLVLGVDTEDDSNSARSFLRAVGATYPQVVDQQGALRIQLRAVGLPVTVLLRLDGSVAYRRLGEMHPADIEAAITAVGLSEG